MPSQNPFTRRSPPGVPVSPYIAKGQHLTCERGHVLATFQRDIAFGELQGLENDLGEWTVPKPATGTLLPLYCTCGALYAKTGSNQGQYCSLHVDGKWK